MATKNNKSRKYKEDIEEVIKIFSAYLGQNSFRKTPERFAILKEIYLHKSHFDAESLYLLMKKKKYIISRATIYNTIDLLLSCDLISKHSFGKNFAQYEKSYGFKQHDHLICTDCGNVLEFCDPRIHQVQSMIGKLLNFQITHHALNLYGKCNKLAETGKCELYK